MLRFLKKLVTLLPLFSLTMLAACRHTQRNPIDNNVATHSFPTGSDLLLLGGALVLLFLVPVVVLYWPHRRMN